MGKLFNVSADCKPELHYMVNLEGRLAEMKTMIDRGDYFTINRARQYGKTTILKALERYLEPGYFVLRLDFQRLSHKDFETEEAFVEALSREIFRKVNGRKKLSPHFLEELKGFIEEKGKKRRLALLFDCFSKWCGEEKVPIVFMIDEVDSATNNQVFLDFLSQMRSSYIEREEVPAFQSVILAGVYDIKNLKRKMNPGGNEKNNSPWNVAADFLVEMSFLPEDIAGMLADYERDYQTGMDVGKMAELIYEYTTGYPFLVSRICKLLDERIAGKEDYPSKKEAWTDRGLQEAVKMLLTEKNTLFESLTGKLAEYPELRNLLYSLLFTGSRIPYQPFHQSIEMAEQFGFIKNWNGEVAVSNRIFETILYNLFLSEEVLDSELYKAGLQEKNQFVRNGHLDMERILERFVLHFDELYGDQKEEFLEEAGRRYFLLYLKPIINGTGNYYIEARTRNMERTDVIVDYRGEQFVLELKIWRGTAYQERGEQQLSEYLEYYHLNKGYMLSFNFNQKKQIGVKHVKLGEKLLIEAVV